MSYWRVGLRVEEERWFCASLDDQGNPVLESKVGYETPGKSVEKLLNEVEDWLAFRRTRFL